MKETYPCDSVFLPCCHRRGHCSLTEPCQQNSSCSHWGAAFATSAAGGQFGQPGFGQKKEPTSGWAQVRGTTWWVVQGCCYLFPQISPASGPAGC
jgi:hypothetical protein